MDLSGPVTLATAIITTTNHYYYYHYYQPVLLLPLQGRAQVYTGFWLENLRERDHLGDPGVDGRIILRWIFRKWDVGLWTGSSWLRIGTGGGHL